jgi:hypothetical protein
MNILTIIELETMVQRMKPMHGMKLVMKLVIMMKLLRMM